MWAMKERRKYLETRTVWKSVMEMEQGSGFFFEGALTGIFGADFLGVADNQLFSSRITLRF